MKYRSASRGTLTKLSWVRCITFIAVALAGSVARAQARENQRLDPPEEVTRARGWALELNPLELTFARASFNCEVALNEHDGLMLGVIAQPKTGDIGAGAWGELGYRFYAGEGGLQGFFVGPSAGAGAFDYFTDSVRGAQPARSIDVAFDAGYQFAFRSGVILGLGLGVQYQHVWHDYSVRNDPINQFELASSVLPRLLLSFGYGP